MGGGGGGGNSSGMGGGGKGGSGKAMKAGDWTCPSCGDHQFARNLVCKMCNTPRPGGPDLDDVCKSIEPADASEVDQFAAMYGVEAHGVEKLKTIDPRLARAAISKDMTGVNDATGTIIGRCKKYMTMQKGDWICPACFDIQFAKKTECSSCSNPRP